MIQDLQTAHWEHSEKKAELRVEDATLIQIDFEKDRASVRFGQAEFEIGTEGFWCPRIIIKQSGKVVAVQKHTGFWGTQSKFELDGETYSAKTKQGALFNITYANSDAEILTYKLDASQSKLQIRIEVKSADVPGQHLLLLMALGFYSIRNVAQEAGAADFILSATA